MDKDEFDFLKQHSSAFLDMAFRSDKCEIVSNPDGYGKETSDCGDTIELFLTIVNDRIKWASFVSEGCINTRACANAIVLLSEGKSLTEARKITSEMIINLLETLPLSSHHCADIATGALYKALSDSRKIKQNPWQKSFPRY